MSANNVLTPEVIQYMGSSMHNIDIGYARELAYIIHRMKPWEDKNV